MVSSHDSKEKIFRRLVMLFPVLIVVSIIGVLCFNVFSRKPSTTVEFNVAPSSSEIIFDGRSVANNTVIDVVPGEYVVTVSFDGFESQTQTVSISENESRVVLIALDSNDSSTEEWYRDHPDDALVKQTIFTQEFEAASAKMAKDYPIVTNLPIHGVNYAIGYGPCDETSDKTCIKVTAPFGVRNSALVELYENDPDKDLARYDILILGDYKNPFSTINQSVNANLDGLDSSTNNGDLNEKVLIEEAAEDFASQVTSGYIDYVAVERFLNSDNTVAKVMVAYSTDQNNYSQTETYYFLMAKKNGSWEPVTKLQLVSTYVEYPDIPGEYIKKLMTPNLR